MGLVQSIAAVFSRFARQLLAVAPTGIRAMRSAREGSGWRRATCGTQRYRVLYRNFRAPRSGGEVDIVCRDKATDMLVFVEVKTRRSLGLWRARRGRDPRQARCLIARGALAWLRLLGNPDIPVRFDIVEILHDGKEPEFHLIIKDAFKLPEPYIY